MLTRLEVKGFKNLVDVDVRFGPFTCIAGANGVGKSNLFDAVLFLSEIADRPFVEAARGIRGGESVGGLFSAHGGSEMTLCAEMLIPSVGEDDFGQRAQASATFVRYELCLCLQAAATEHGRERIRLVSESLSYVPRSKARVCLAFDSSNEWRDSVVSHSQRRTPFISTDSERGIVHLHSDRMQGGERARRGGGNPAGFAAETLPRSCLSSAQNADETRTAVLVRREMRSWRLLQLEPSAMREPDDYQSVESLTVSGEHIPAALFRIAMSGDEPPDDCRVYAMTANRLAELVDGVRTVRVDRDDTRKAMTFMMTDRYGLELPASALSDGTLRFIALTVLQQDSREGGLICLEEPENGIHPQRVDAMIRLLSDIAVDSTSPVGDENPLRQIIINTHSPLVAGRVGVQDLLLARTRRRRHLGRQVPELTLACLDSTWRALRGSETISKGEIIAYLGGLSPQEDDDEEARRENGSRRVIDHLGEQLQLPFGGSG